MGKKEKNKVSSKKKEKLPYQFLDSFYFKQKFDKGKKNRSEVVRDDYIVIVYRDEKDGKKKLYIKPQPTFRFYMAKPEVELEHRLKYINKDLVEPINCRYTDLIKTIAKMDDGNLETFYDMLKKEGRTTTEHYYTQSPYVFSSDIHIEDYYKDVFLEKYEPKKNKITKSYFDIEVDTIDIVGFPEEHEAKCPVNAIALINEENKTCYTFILRNDKNPQIQELEDDIESFKGELKEDLADDLDYKFLFFNNELNLIKSFYNHLNKLQPDFCLAWNMKFDKLTLLNRIKKLGGDPEDIICHQDFPEEIQECFYYEDKMKQKYSEKGDYFSASSYTQYLDQLIVYASLRKGLGEKESYALNSVAKDELGDEKLDYEDKGTIKTLPYTDFRLFIKYNIKDVILLRKLEDKNEDVNMLYSIAEMTRTRLNKAMRKTISLKNMATMFYRDQGVIMANNSNNRPRTYGDDNKPKDNSEPTEKFEGAVVADPTLNSYNGMTLNGQKSKYMYQKVIDFDLAALYPSIIRAFNIDTTTQYGRLYISNLIPTKEYDPAGDFTDNLETGNMTSVCKKWFNLPSTEELLKGLEDIS